MTDVLSGVVKGEQSLERDYIQMILNDADFMIVIMGNCYGTTDAEGVSYTEKEFEYAIKKNIPVIAF